MQTKKRIFKTRKIKEQMNKEMIIETKMKTAMMTKHWTTNKKQNSIKKKRGEDLCTSLSTQSIMEEEREKGNKHRIFPSYKQNSKTQNIQKETIPKAQLEPIQNYEKNQFT